MRLLKQRRSGVLRIWRPWLRLGDRDLVKVLQKMNAKRFDNIMLKTKTVSARALPEGIEVTFESAEPGGTAPAPQVYDLLLQAVGRTPNGKKAWPSCCLTIHPRPTATAISWAAAWSARMRAT